VIERGRVLYHVVCAAPPALDVANFVTMAQEASWAVCVIPTPRAATWIDLSVLRELSGFPVRTDHKKPGEPDVLPPPSAITVGPATFNTLNKWALGIADNLVLGLLTEALGKGLPVAALPYLNMAQAAHPALMPSVERLRAAGAAVLLGDERHSGYRPHPPGEGDRHEMPWRMLLDAVSD
jgi:hypothetical protein